MEPATTLSFVAYSDLSVLNIFCSFAKEDLRFRDAGAANTTIHCISKGHRNSHRTLYCNHQQWHCHSYAHEHRDPKRNNWWSTRQRSKRCFLSHLVQKLLIMCYSFPRNMVLDFVNYNYHLLFLLLLNNIMYYFL